MKSGSNAWRWRRFAVDLLIGASTVLVAFAAIKAGTDVPYLLPILGAIALVGIGLTLENTQPKPAQSELPSIEHLGTSPSGWPATRHAA
jgi:hypothetical protein